MSEWTFEDSAAAVAQGWEIFETDRDPEEDSLLPDGTPYGHRPFELQRLDHESVFNDDEACWAFVKQRAAEGDALTNKALAFLKEHSPAEYEAILAFEEGRS